MPAIDPAQRHFVHTLYHAHHRWLLGLLRRKLGNRDSAADLAHDAFERILRTDPAHLAERPRAYLSTVAQHLVVSHYRRATVERAWLDTLASLPAGTAPSPDEHLQALEMLTRLCHMLDGLNLRHRRLFLRIQLDGLSYAAAADEAGMSLAAVKKAMSRALVQCCLAIDG